MLAVVLLSEDIFRGLKDGRVKIRSNKVKLFEIQISKHYLRCFRLTLLNHKLNAFILFCTLSVTANKSHIQN